MNGAAFGTGLMVANLCTECECLTRGYFVLHCSVRANTTTLLIDIKRALPFLQAAFSVVSNS